MDKKVNPEVRQIGLFAKKRELECLKKKNESEQGWQKHYWEGKAVAFSELWERIAFGGRSVSTIEYNRESYLWVEELEGAELLPDPERSK